MLNVILNKIGMSKNGHEQNEYKISFVIYILLKIYFKIDVKFMLTVNLEENWKFKDWI